MGGFNWDLTGLLPLFQNLQEPIQIWFVERYNQFHSANLFIKHPLNVSEDTDGLSGDSTDHFIFTCIYFIGLHLFSKQGAEGKGFISPVE